MFKDTKKSASSIEVRTRRRRFFAGLATVIAVALVMSGCGSSATTGGGTATTGGSSSSSGVTYAASQLAKYESPSGVFTPPGPALTNVASLKGKTVWYVPIALQVPFFAGVIAGMTSALGMAGMNLHVCDGAGIASTISQCLNQAAAAKPAAVVVDSISNELAPTAFAALKQAQVPVASGNEGYLSPGTNSLAYVSYDGPKMLALTADSVINDSKGKADVLIAEVSDSGYTTAAVQDGALPEFSKYCPACKVKVIAATTANYAQYATLTATAFASDPSINYVIPEYDSTILGVTQGLQSAGTANKVKMATSTSTLIGLQDIKSGKLISDTGFDVYGEGFAYVDQALRLALNQSPVQNENLGLKVFSPSNIVGLELTAVAADNGSWFGSGGYKDGFKKLWGLS